ATSGSPNTALAYQRLVNPSASAATACSTMRSAVAPPPGSPILMGRPYGADVRRAGAGRWSVPSSPSMSATQLILALVVLFVGSAIQGSVGFGLNLFAAPLLVLIDPGLVPAP